MTVLSEDQAREFASLLESYEDTIATVNESKKDTLDDIRQVLRDYGLKGSALADELAQFRDAVTEHRLMRVNPEKAERKSNKRDGATDYLFMLTCKPLARVRGTKVDAHHPLTGEVTEIADELMSAVTEQHPGLGAGVEGMENGARANPARTMLEPNLGYAAGRTAEDELISAAGGSPTPKPLPVHVHRTIAGAPLKPAIDPEDLEAVTAERQRLMGDIPAQFRRAPVQGNA